jgi:hypothetical protein
LPGQGDMMSGESEISLGNADSDILEEIELTLSTGCIQRKPQIYTTAVSIVPCQDHVKTDSIDPAMFDFPTIRNMMISPF